jgi:hypothetical protein
VSGKNRFQVSGYKEWGMGQRAWGLSNSEVGMRNAELKNKNPVRNGIEIKGVRFGV